MWDPWVPGPKNFESQYFLFSLLYIPIFKFFFKKNFLGCRVHFGQKKLYICMGGGRGFHPISPIFELPLTFFETSLYTKFEVDNS